LSELSLIKEVELFENESAVSSKFTNVTQMAEARLAGKKALASKFASSPLEAK
jgi:hypothetical protein